MNKLRKELKEYHLQGFGSKRAEVYKPLVSMYHEATGEVEPRAFGYASGYMLKATIAVHFWANEAQFSDARNNAEKIVLSGLYGDVLNAIDITRSALFAHDIEAALSVLDGLQKHLLEF